MVKRMIGAAVLLGTLGMMDPANGAPSGIPVFGDDFNVTGLFVENWETTRDAAVVDGKVRIPSGSSIGLRRTPEGNFAFAADLTVKKPGGDKAGHCGATLDGIHFMINPGGFANTAYRLPGEARSRGTSRPIPGFSFGTSYRMRVSREQLGDLFKYTYSLDGVAVDSFVAKMPVNSRIAFYGYRTEMGVDNFQLLRLAEGDGSNNLAVNSSFEVLQEGMPNYMKPRLGGRYTFDGKWTDFLDFFAVDRAEAFDGRQSVRMTAGAAPNAPTSNGVGTHNVNIVAGMSVTFSVYLKASEDDFPVTLNLWELHYRNHSKKIRVSRTWERYEFTLEAPERATVRGNITFSQPGTLWADAVQVEIGAASTPYMPSPLDRDKFSKDSDVEPGLPEDIVLALMPRAPVIDGVIEEQWIADGTKVDGFLLQGEKPPVNRTEAYVACDADNLYIAVRAFVPDPAQVQATAYERDNLRIHGEDCIELLLDTSFSRESYYHLTMNAAGAKTDMGPGRLISWNGEWQGMAKVNDATQSIDFEFRIPITLFTDLNLAGRWGLNIGRNDRAAGNVVSLIRTKQVNFHLPELFPALVFPEGMVDAYRMGFRSLELTARAEGHYGVSATIANRGGVALESEIRIHDAASGSLIGSRKVALAEGDTDALVPVALADGKTALDAVAEIVVQGKTRLSSQRRLTVKQRIELFTRRNYYMNEDAAVLVGSLRVAEAGRMTGLITVAGRSFESGMDEDFAIDVPLTEIPDGEHVLTLTVYDGKDLVAEGTTPLVKRSFKQGATQIDRQRRCLVVDGKPTLVIAPFFGVPRGIKPEDREQVVRNMLRHHTDMGYRSLMIGAVDDTPVAEAAQDLFDLCAKEDIKVLYWPFQSWKRRDDVGVEQRLQSIRSDDIIGWLVVDEPELYAKSEEVKPFMDAFRAASPYTPVFMNNTLIGIPSHFADLSTDILMLDDYLTNREGRKVAEMIHATEKMWEAGREDRKPVFYFLAGENLHNHYREPTSAEQIAQTYGVIITGARGVSYFLSLPLYPQHYRACVQVNRELLELEDVILSLEKTSSARISDAAVRFMTRKLGDRVYVIALNASNDRAADVEIALPAEFRYAHHAEVQFEDRTTAVRNGRIRDRFAPLSRHVYMVEVEYDK